MGLEQVRRAAARTHRAVDALFGEKRHRPAEEGLDFFGPARSRIGEDAAEVQGRRSGDAHGQFQSGFRRLDAAALAAGVALDENRQRPRRIEGAGKPVYRHRAVGDDAEMRHALVQGAQALELCRTEDVVGDEDVREAGIDEDLGLAHLLAIDAGGAGRALRLGDRHDLVGLDMGAQRLAVLIEIGLRAADIGGQPVLVDDGHGGGNLIERGAGFGPRGMHGKPSESAAPGRAG